MTAPQTQSDTRNGLSRPGLWLGLFIVGAILCVVLGFSSPAAFWSGYLVAAVFWVSVSMGCAAITMIHGTSGGRWGRAIGRSLHAGISTVLVSLIGCWIMALGAAQVFPWATKAGLEHLNQHQQIWLAPMTVGIRFAVISAIWLGMCSWLNARYRKDALSADPQEYRSGKPFAVGLLVFFLTFSIVAIDFMMALSPAWASSMYPLIRILNCGVSGLALAAISHNLRISEPTKEQAERLIDVGNLLQAFNLLWTYLSFSQYILIWTGDIAGEVEYYMQRRQGIWMGVSYLLFALHFVLPFLLLLSRNVKRHPRRLSQVASLLLAMCLLDIAWTLLPSIPVSTGPALLSVLAATCAIGGVWMMTFSRAFASLPDLPIGDDHVAAAAAAVEEAAGETT